MSALLTVFQAFAISLIYTKQAIAGVVGGLQEIFYALKLLHDAPLINLKDGLDKYTETIKDDLRKIKEIWDDSKNPGDETNLEVGRVLHPFAAYQVNPSLRGPAPILPLTTRRSLGKPL